MRMVNCYIYANFATLMNLEFDIVCLEIERKEPICLFTMLNWLFCFCHLMF